MIFLKNILSLFIFFLILYLFIYNPVFHFFRFGFIKLFWIPSFFYILFKKDVFNNLVFFRFEILFLFALIFYVLIITFLMSGNSYVFAYSHFLVIVECIIIPIFLVNFYKEKILKIGVFNVIVILGFIASLISLFLLSNSEVNLWVRQNLIIDDLDSVDMGPLQYVRGFTIAGESTFGYGILQGIIFGICLFVSSKSNLYLIPYFPLIVSILINSRVGFLLVILSVLLMPGKVNLKFLFLFFGFVFLLVFSLSFLSEDLFNSFSWSFSFFEETINLFNGETSGDSTYDVLSDYLFFPDSFFGILFGLGQVKIGFGSDIGYVNHIFIGGLFYLLLMFLFYGFLFVRFVNFNFPRRLSLFFIIGIFIVNLKGPAFLESQSFFRCIMFLFVFFGLEHFNNLRNKY